jgi:DNA-binding NtrC family response regulator
LHALRDALRSSSFEEGAHRVLALVGQLAAERLRYDVELRRVMLHLRPHGSYRGLVVHELSEGAGSPVPSATLWALVQQHKAPIPFDVRMNSVDAAAPEAEEGDVAESVLLMRERDVTHVLALPLWAPDGQLTGMVSLEADCVRATGIPGFWTPVLAELDLFTDLAAPGLLQLPVQATDMVRDDPLLPVVGPGMAPLVNLLGIFASQPETLLLTGQTGTGKSRMAEWCHQQSGRGSAPFVHLDLLTVPEDMQMAELFGWKRGAFTGAVNDKPGAIERAHGGTLFLDEIDKLSLKAQAGLLQLLETRRWRRLGDRGGERSADVRFIVGSNVALAEAVRGGSFREDLYYRINVLPVQLPSLDERADEVPAWAAYMAKRRHTEGGLPGSVSLTAEGASLLASRSWPGNLRQLDNVVRRAYAIALTGLSAEGVVLTRAHVDRALGFESPGARSTSEVSGLLGALQAAARAYLDGVDEGALDDAEAFRGVLLAEAAERHGGVKEAYLWLGREATVARRNHQREYKKAMGLLTDTLARVDEENPYDQARATRKPNM